MSARTHHPGQAASAYAPVFDRIAAGALQRELDDELPAAPVRWLKESGFGALRVPVEHGGGGVSVPELTQLWIELAAADANLPQALRGHFALVEDRVWQHRRGRDQQVWFDRFVTGEIGSTAAGTQRAVLTRSGDGYRIDGTTYDATGSIFAEWADVHVRRADGDGFVTAVVDTRRPGVTVVDDSDGFGQRGAGGGTTTFADVAVPAAHVLPAEERFPYRAALDRLNLLATLAGIGRAALADTVAAARARERVHDDSQVLARVGEIAARVYAAEAATLRVAIAVQAVADAVAADPAEIARLDEVAEVESATAHVVVTDLVLTATNDLFDTLGAPATDRARGLDRHWRNARTVSSHEPRTLTSRVAGGWLVEGACRTGDR